MRAAGQALIVLASHWRRRPAQFAALLLGLAAATALWSGVQALNAEARASYASAEAALDAQPDTLAAADGGLISQQVFLALRRAGWPVSPMLEGRVTLEGAALSVRGVEPATLLSAPGGAAGAGAMLGAMMDGQADMAAFMLPPHRVWMAPETMRRLGLSPGDAPVTDDGRALPPVEARRGVEPGVALMDIGATQTLLNQTVLDMDGALTGLILTGPPSLTAPELESIAPGLRRVVPEGPRDLSDLTASFHLNLTAFGLLAFIVGLFIAAAAAGLAFEQRLPALRTLRACGVSRRALAGALIVEMLVLALLAGALGLMAGYALAALLLPGVGMTLQALYGAPAPDAPAFRAAWAASGLAMGLAGAAAALGAGLARAWRMPVLETARPGAWAAARRRWTQVQAGAAALLCAAWLGLLAFGEGLAAGFLALGALLLAAALALPPMLALLLRAAQARGGGPMTEWFWAEARRDLSGLSLALTALLLALAANIGVGSMVGGFRAAFTDWLDRRLAADVYLNLARPDLAEDIADFLRARDDVTAALPTLRADTRTSDWPVEVIGFTDHAFHRQTWPVLGAPLTESDWDSVARGEAVLISEQTARRLHLARGDVFALPTPSGDWRLRVAGLYADYGNPRGQIRAEIGAAAARWPDAQISGLEIVTAPGAAPEVMSALRTRFGPAAGPVFDQAAVKRFSLTVFERTFAVTAALGALTLAVAGGALLAGLGALAQRRLPHLAPVWAMGATRAHLSLLELGRTLALALLTAMLAIPLGIALAWMLVAVINVEAFGWRLPLHVFPVQWLAMAGLALLIALLAGAGPALRLARTRPAALAGVFAHER